MFAELYDANLICHMTREQSGIHLIQSTNMKYNFTL